VARIAKLDDEWHASDQGGDSSWRVHTSGQWFMSAQERLYFHVPTQTAFIETAEGSGVFMPLGGSGDAGADATDQSGEDQQAAPAEDAAADAEYEEPSGEGEGGEGVGEDENEMDEEVREMEMDLAKEVRAHAAQIPGEGKDSSTTEDRHVTKELLPLDVIIGSGEEACCYYFAMFDGHNGQQCAEYACHHLKNNLMSYMRQLKKGGDECEWLKKCLRKAFQQTDNNWLHIAKKQNIDAGCTALVCLLYGPDEKGELRLVTAHAGDTRAVMVRGGAAKALTRDHKPNDKKEKDRIKRAGGMVEQVGGAWRVLSQQKDGLMGLSTSRAFGDIRLKQPKQLVLSEPDIATYTIDLERDLALVLATDGVWDVVSSDDAVRIVETNISRSPKKAASALVHTAKQRGSKDDKTAMVVLFGWHSSLRDLPPPAAEDEQDHEAEEGEEGLAAEEPEGLEQNETALAVEGALGDRAEGMDKAEGMVGVKRRRDEQRGEEEEDDIFAAAEAARPAKMPRADERPSEGERESGEDGGQGGQERGRESGKAKDVLKKFDISKKMDFGAAALDSNDDD